jgi:hypothetical protein
MILTAVVIAQAAQLRQLVYSFSVGVNNDTTDSSAGNGTNAYSGSKSDMGTITVGVVGLEADGGLVVKVSESGRDNRTVAPATCVVYPSTNVLCDQTTVVTPEEYAVLRPLNPKFVDPTTLDSAGHWRIAPPGSGVTIDYTLGKVDANGVVPISGVRDEKSPQSTVHTEITYSYNAPKVVPTQVKEYQRIHQQSGTTNGTVTIDVTATLSSDSRAN